MKITIADILKKYASRIDRLDLELLIAYILKKPREFVLTHPEYELSPLKIKNLELKITRRQREEPLAYILGFREFFGLPFLVSPATLIPRPETELMVEEALAEVESLKSKVESIIDIGTGSGNIIISIAKNLNTDLKFFAIDISAEALRIAKRNAKKNNVAGKIKFLRGNLLEPFIKNSKLEIRNSRTIVLANLPYLSREIYNATLPTVKKYEPKSALYSPKEGLAHYEELFQQIKTLQKAICSSHVTCYAEISPEQKAPMRKLIRRYFSGAKLEFRKDLAGKWRLAIITL
ncbi:MAG: peptide chain release factor N(5)-glutamine methyltransferase [Parcubacteria group bacterium]